MSKINECNPKYKECKYYIPKNRVNSRCVRESYNYCEIEQEYYEKCSKQVNAVFEIIQKRLIKNAL